MRNSGMLLEDHRSSLRMFLIGVDGERSGCRRIRSERRTAGAGSPPVGGVRQGNLKPARMRPRPETGIVAMRKFRFACDSPLEGDGFEPSVPLVSRGAIRRGFPKLGARLAASWGIELRRRSSIWEFDPTSRDQIRSILLRHLDDAIQADGDMPV